MRRLIPLLLLVMGARSVAADLTLVFEPRWGGQPLAVPSPVVRNVAGQPLRLTRFAALVSGVTLRRADGSGVTLAGQYGFLDFAADRRAVTLHAVPPGDYTGVAFDLGLPGDVNHADPGRWPAGHPLNPLVNRLHWSWKGGYVFVALEGRWSEAAVAAAAPGEQGFSFHLAGDEHRIPVRFAAAFAVRGATTMSFAIELRPVVGGSALATNDGSDNTHSADGDPVAPRIATALTRGFFWLGAEPTPAALAAHGTGRAAAAEDVVHPAMGTHPLAFDVPAGFPAPSLPADNPLTSEGVALGRALFTDARLSSQHRQSCASCHEPDRAFSDRVALSRGADGQRGVRNAMPLFNLAWASSYAWDGAKPHIRDQVLAAMTNPVEMHADPARVLAELNADPALRAACAAAFGTPELTPPRVALALEQYLLTLVSADSKFDRATHGQAELTEQEKEGFALFMTEYDPARGRRGADCFHCHGGALFTDYDFKNNGLDRTASDAGRRGVTGRESDAGKFRTPSLRNVAVTGPYMHDGRFPTLEAVIAHYDHGVRRSATLDPNLAKHPEAGLQLTTTEQQALVAFLRTLTDPRWIQR